MNLTTGKKRNVALLGREEKHLRTIKLLATQVDVKIDPSRWVQTAQAKNLDDKNTEILRVYKHKTIEDKYLVHGMRAKVHDGETKARVVAEAWDAVAVTEAVPAVLLSVAEHCGLSALVGQVK
jgi:hypothetical protein